MNFQSAVEFSADTLIVKSLEYVDSLEVVIPWSRLSTRSQSILRQALGTLRPGVEIEMGFTIEDIGGITFGNLREERNIGSGTIALLLKEIQESLTLNSKEPKMFSRQQPLWNISIGTKVLRKEIHNRYGGVREGGISPVGTKSRNILIFSHPRANAEHGYEPDIWLDEDTFLYCGEGPSGDQEMVRYNKSVLQHAEKDKILRVFDGTRGEVIYRGAFELDRDDPWFLKESIGYDGKPRKVIMFRMVRIDATAISSQITEPQDPPYRWVCVTHSSGGTSPTTNEVEFLATSHMRFHEQSNAECEIQISSPDSDFGAVDEEKLVIRNRNREMGDLRSAGKSLEEIGEKYGVTRERVRQILSKIGGPTRQDVKALRESIKEDRREDIKAAALVLVKQKSGLDLNQIAEKLNLSTIELSRLMSPQELNLFSKPLKAGNVKWTDDQIVATLQEAATLEFPLTVAAYAKLLEEGFLRCSHLPTLSFLASGM
jgi:DNA-binding CsgD family transcriptional regulator